MTFDAVDCVTKASSICYGSQKISLLSILSRNNGQDITFCTLSKSKMSYPLARDAKVTKCYLCNQFFAKF